MGQRGKWKKNCEKLMRKSVIGLTFSALLLGLAFHVEAQQPKKVPRIGYLSSRDPASESARSEAIRLALRERGYIEGQNVATEYRYAEGKRERNEKIPIVIAGGGADPVEAGFVESLARPGGNVTGITLLTRELSGKRLELLKEAVPKVARVAVLYDPARPSAIELKEVQTAGRALGLTIQPWEVRAVDDFEGVFATQSKGRPDGLYVIGGVLMRNNEKRTVGLALKSRLPSVYPSREFVDAGGLMSYGADPADSYKRVAYFVDRILKGAKPADLPVEQPTRFEFVINLKTAKQIDLTIPPDLLARATKIIR